MAVNWTRLISDKCESEGIVLVVLLIFILFGVGCVWLLLALRICCNRSLVIHTTKISFLTIKLISMYIFGLGFLFHCGLYIWKHATPNKCEKLSILGIIYNAISIFYIFSLFIYFALIYVRKHVHESSCLENIASLGILLANLCIWLDTLFSESEVLFIHHNDTSHNHTRAIDAIEKTDPFLSPAIIEFSLMAVNMLFTNIDDPTDLPSNSTNTDIHNESNGNEFVNCTRLKKDCIICLRLCSEIAVQILFFLLSFALFAVTFTVLLTTDSSKNFIDHPNDFVVYVSIQLSMKIFMAFFIIVCLCLAWTSISFHFNVSAFVLLIACFGNVVYHVVYCFALSQDSTYTPIEDKTNQTLSNSSNSKNKSDEIIANIDTGIIVSWVDNIVSILLAGLQTMFLLGSHSLTVLTNNCCGCSLQRKHFLMYYACSILGVLNLGLWISDSIGEERLPVLSIYIYRSFKLIVWLVISKIILPLTIFFRFHSGLHFLEISWKYKYIRYETEICRNDTERTMLINESSTRTTQV